MYKKACTCKVVILRNKPIAFLTSCLPSPSSLLKLPNVPYSPRVRESKTVLDYKSHSTDSIFQSFSVELGFWIPFLSGIPDSLSCILGSKAQDSGFNEQNFPGIRILQAKISHIPESRFLYMRRYLYILFIFLSRYFLYVTQFGGSSHCLNFDKFLDTVLLSGRDSYHLSSPLSLV